MQECRIEKKINLILLQNSGCPNFQNELLVLIHHEIQTVFLGNYQPNFLHQDLNAETFCRRRTLVAKSIDFVLCFGVLIFRRAQTTALNFDISSLFQRNILHNHWLNFLLQSFNLKPFRFGGLLVLMVIDFFREIGILIVWECQNFLNFDDSPYSNSSFSKTTVIFFPTIFAIKNLLFLRSIGVEKINFVPALEAWWSKNTRIFHDKDSSRFSNSCFFSSTCVNFPSKSQSIVLYSSRTIYFQKSWKLFFTLELESRLSKSGISAIGIEISQHSNSSFSKTTDLNSIKIWIECHISLNVSEMQPSLVVSLRLECW